MCGSRKVTNCLVVNIRNSTSVELGSTEIRAVVPKIPEAIQGMLLKNLNIDTDTESSNIML